jgi:hypothetical protein
MFPELSRELGPSEMVKSDHIEKQACYRKNSQVIEFYVSTVGFGYNVYKNNPELKNCGVTTRSLGSEFGLELGLKEPFVREMLGMQSETRSDKVWYNNWVQEIPSKEIKDRMRKAHGLSEDTEIWFDVYSFISVGFESNILTHFGVHTTETF